jgi:hypothetical protein
MKTKNCYRYLPVLALLLWYLPSLVAQQQKPQFRVIGFYTAKEDPAHISFVQEANRQLFKWSQENHFLYDSTNNWNNLNREFLQQYELVLFLDTRPELPAQRKAFQEYMENGGSWMGFHFAAFALTPSAFNQDWDWYHQSFLGSGQYLGNTWRPTSAVLKNESRGHPATKNLPAVFTAAPNEWYRWEKDLRKNPDIEILLSIDSSSFPLGTGPKAHEIWHGGDYPVVWTNRNYRMIYLNMGHNDMDYAKGTQASLSTTFGSSEQNRLILDAIFWLGKNR